MPTLIVLNAATGDVVSLLPHDQSPGSAVEANAAGRWAFAYVADAEPDEMWEYVQAMQDPDPEAEDLRERKQSVNVAGLPKLGNRTFSEYRPFGNDRAYEATKAEIDNYVTHHTG